MTGLIIILEQNHFLSNSSSELRRCFTLQDQTIPIEASKQFAESEPRIERRNTMNIRTLTVAAIIALAASSASFAQSFDGDEAVTSISSTPIVRVQTFGAENITVSKASTDIGDLSTGNLFMNPAIDVSNQFKVVSIKNADCYDIKLTSATLEKDDLTGTASRASFKFNVRYARGVDSGIQVVTVTLENLQTGKQFDVSFQTVLI
jgi:hypothetical protein